MRTIILSMMALIFSTGVAMSQKLAFIDTDYIFSNIPAYQSALEQINQSSEQWQKEVDEKYQSIETMYKKCQESRSTLSVENQRKQEEEIIAQENQAKELQKKYFGREGLLAQKQTELLQPIQERVTGAVRDLASDGGYDLVFDTAADAGIIYSNPKNDQSDEILQRLGYK